MSGIITQVAEGALVDAASAKIADGAWVNAAVAKGRSLVDANVEDDAVAAGLHAMLDDLETPEAKQTLVGVAQHEFTALTARLGMGMRGAAREAFMRDQASFALRHQLLQADTAANNQATKDHIAFVDGLETLALGLLEKGGAAAAPFLLELL